MKQARMPLLVAVLLSLAMVASAGNESTLTTRLLNGSTITSATRSAWIPVRGANRIAIRTWSSLGAAAVNSGDSLYADSLVAFEVFFSDSVRTPSSMIAADSVIMNCVSLSTMDSTRKMINILSPPLMEPLRPAVTGSGTYTLIYPVQAGTINVDGSILPNYMAVQVRPYKRLVIAGSTDSTQGVRGLRMDALVTFKNR